MTDEAGAIIGGKGPAVLTEAGCGGTACAPFRYRNRRAAARGGLSARGRLAVPVACHVANSIYDANSIDFMTEDPA
ncbi:hypothetical protein ACF09Y_23775 [Streptomyces massasporeus]|uniref:hypothetical protein n=1 Tax=Streptomyces massasporeus TaxID=67324 RepID=UPI0036F6A9B0